LSALENFKAYPNSARQDNIGCDPVSDGQSSNRGQLAVRKSEDKHDQPDTNDAHPTIIKRFDKRFSNLTILMWFDKICESGLPQANSNDREIRI
jgi:hypothetical protein